MCVRLREPCGAGSYGTLLGERRRAMNGPELVRPTLDGVRGHVRRASRGSRVRAGSCDVCATYVRGDVFQVGWTFRPIFSWAS